MNNDGIEAIWEKLKKLSDHNRFRAFASMFGYMEGGSNTKEKKLFFEHLEKVIDELNKK